MDNQLTVQHGNLQMMPIEDAKNWYKEFVDFSKSILKKDLDFGEIPGTNKPTLYKAGAEKLRFVYGFGVEMACIKEVVDLDRPFIKYTYRCTIVSKSGQKLAECDGSCNSLEPKFGYLWKTKEELGAGYDIAGLPTKTSGKNLSEFDFAINKAETTGQYGKPAEYWQKFKDAIAKGTAKKVNKKSKAGKDMVAYELNEAAIVYRINNPDVIGVDNTLMKMAQKRAFVGATLLATGASEFFTQDIEDMDLGAGVYNDNGFTDIAHEDVPPPPPPPPPPPAAKKEPIAAERFTKAIDLIENGKIEFAATLRNGFALTPKQLTSLKGSEKKGEELASAIASLSIATTSDDLEAFKEQLPSYIVENAAFITAAGARLEAIIAQPA